jgi:anti-sigma regulatory factor (Ser/Thr protein kinase)
LLADNVIDDAVLVVSELISNSVEHTRSQEIVLTIRIDDRGLVVEVHDQGSGLPTAWPVPGFRGRSRGLMMIGKLSSAVSSRVGPEGGCVVEAVIPLAGGSGI